MDITGRPHRNNDGRDRLKTSSWKDGLWHQRCPRLSEDQSALLLTARHAQNYRGRLSMGHQEIAGEEYGVE